MAGTISYTFDPNQLVWVIDETACDAGSVIRQGTIIRVVGVVIDTAIVTYDVRLGTNAGTKAFYEEDIFVSITDATVELEARLSA